MSIANVILGTTETVIHTGAVKDDAVLSITFCNITNAEVTFTLHGYAAASGPAGDSNRMMYKTLEPYASYIWQSTEKFLIDLNDVISAIASTANSIVATKVFVR